MLLSFQERFRLCICIFLFLEKKNDKGLSYSSIVRTTVFLNALNKVMDI